MIEKSVVKVSTTDWPELVNTTENAVPEYWTFDTLSFTWNSQVVSVGCGFYLFVFSCSAVKQMVGSKFKPSHVLILYRKDCLSGMRLYLYFGYKELIFILHSLLVQITNTVYGYR